MKFIFEEVVRLVLGITTTVFYICILTKSFRDVCWLHVAPKSVDPPLLGFSPRLEADISDSSNGLFHYQIWETFTIKY